MSDSVHYCICGNIFDISDNLDNKFTNKKLEPNTPYFYCPSCSNIQKIEPKTSMLIRGGVEQSIYIPTDNKHKIKSKKINKSLLRTKNYICQNKDCPTHKKPETKEAIMEHIAYNSFIVKYICCVCNCQWVNRIN